MKTINRFLCVLVPFIFINILCHLWPNLFTHDMFILCFLLNLTVDRIWGEE